MKRLNRAKTWRISKKERLPATQEIISAHLSLRKEQIKTTYERGKSGAISW